MKKSNFFILLLFLYPITVGVTDNDLPNREAFELKLIYDAEQVLSIPIEESPYIYPDQTVQIFPTETIFIEITYAEKKITEMKTIKTVMDTSRTIEIKFTQELKNGLHSFMMLSIKNPLPFDVYYTAYIYLPKYKKWVPTNVLPIKAGLSSYESWPDLISSLALSKWRLE